MTSWRGVFVVLAGIGAVLAVATALGLRETLPPELRSEGGFATVRATVAELVSDRAFLGYLVLLGLTFGAMFAYIAGSSFVVETIHHGSPQLFSAIFALNGIGLVAASQTNGFLLGRTSARRLLGAGVVASASGGFALLAVVVAGIGLAGIVPALFVLVASLGFVFPNATALALADHPSVAGSASGLIGVFTFAVGAVAAPLVGVAGTDSAYPMAIVIATSRRGVARRAATREKRPRKCLVPVNPRAHRDLAGRNLSHRAARVKRLPRLPPDSLCPF